MAKGGGYGKPPKKHQWKKGQSGNPKGRPKKSDKPLNLSQSLIDAAMTITNVNTKGGETEMTMIDVIIKRLMQEAANGCHKSQRLLMWYMDKFINEQQQYIIPEIIFSTNCVECQKKIEKEALQECQSEIKEKNLDFS